MSDACKEAMWIREGIKEVLDPAYDLTSTIHEDNKGAIDLANGEISQNGFRTKHIDVRFHYIRELLALKKVQIQHIASNLNVADVLTKAYPKAALVKALGRLGIRDSVLDFPAENTGAC